MAQLRLWSSQMMRPAMKAGMEGFLTVRTCPGSDITKPQTTTKMLPLQSGLGQNGKNEHSRPAQMRKQRQRKTRMWVRMLRTACREGLRRWSQPCRSAGQRAPQRRRLNGRLYGRTRMTTWCRLTSHSRAGCANSGKQRRTRLSQVQDAVMIVSFHPFLVISAILLDTLWSYAMSLDIGAVMQCCHS